MQQATLSKPVAKSGSTLWKHRKTLAFSHKDKDRAEQKRDNLKTGSDTGTTLSGTTQAGIRDQTPGTTTTTLLPALCKMFDSVRLILICPEISE